MPYGSTTFYLISFHGDSFEFTARSLPEDIHRHMYFQCVCHMGERSLFVVVGSFYNTIVSSSTFLYDVVDDTWKVG